MKVLIKMFLFLVEHFDILERNVDKMTKEEHESYMRIKSEFDKIPKDKLDNIKEELDSIVE